MSRIPHIPETAPFTAEQRAWLNGFLAGLFYEAPIQPGSPAPAGEPLLILFGSQTGTAEAIAKKSAEEARQRGFAPKVLPLNDCAPAVLEQTARAVIISSTWGDGEPPDNAAQFWSWLGADTAPRFERLQFAVLGLGDRNYSDFCGASKKFDARLEALGARRLVPRCECDVDYESTARNWLDSLWGTLGSATKTNNSTNGHSQPNGIAKTSASSFNRNNPFSARLLTNLLLNQSGSAKEVRHFEFDLADSGLVYEVGDALGVLPANCPDLVNDLLTTLKCRGDEEVKVGECTLPLREALTAEFDITKPSRELLAAVAAKSPSSELAPLLAPDRANDLNAWIWGREVIDILHSLPHPPAVEELLPLLRKQAPRLYSISSSPKAHPGQVHITVSAVRYHTHGRARKGVASTFLADRAATGTGVKVFISPSSGFKLPANGDTPIIMVGPGTGIAPFRAFLQERRSTGAAGRNWLFFGDQTRAGDFLYEEQLTAWRNEGLLTRLDLAFSRDQSDKIYVQHRMLENAAELWSWLEAGAHFYVCGDASRMAKDVDATLHSIIENAGGKSTDQARAYVGSLKSAKRYQRDVY